MSSTNMMALNTSVCVPFTNRLFVKYKKLVGPLGGGS